MGQSCCSIDGSETRMNGTHRRTFLLPNSGTSNRLYFVYFQVLHLHRLTLDGPWVCPCLWSLYTRDRGLFVGQYFSRLYTRPRSVIKSGIAATAKRDHESEDDHDEIHAPLARNSATISIPFVKQMTPAFHRLTVQGPHRLAPQMNRILFSTSPNTDTQQLSEREQHVLTMLLSFLSPTMDQARKCLLSCSYSLWNAV